MRDITERDIRKLLGLPAKSIGHFDIEWDGGQFRDTECFTDKRLPAAIFVDWYEPSEDPFELDENDRHPICEFHEEAFSLEHAKTALASILERAHPDQPIDIAVNAWAFVYAVPEHAVAA